MILPIVAAIMVVAAVLGHPREQPAERISPPRMTFTAEAKVGEPAPLSPYDEYGPLPLGIESKSPTTER